MAIDPKYANLPGIAQNQPDLYESGDLPEADQPTELEEFDNDSVEKVQLKPGEAFDKFRGKGLDGKVDFSDKITRSKRIGYIALSEYEIVGEGSTERETPLQKYQRLQHELRELAEECNQVKDTIQDGASADKVSPVELCGQVQHLQQQLADLHLEQILGPDARVDLADPQGALQKRLLSQIDSFKHLSAPSGDKKAKPGKDGGEHLTYELYYKPEQAKFSNTARMADLDQRLERLEAVIGQNPEKLSSLTADVPNKSLMGAVASLTAKTSLFEPDSLDMVEARLSSVSQKLTQIAEKKESAQQMEKMSKVAALYDLVKKWEELSGTVPHLVDRLTGLKDLHEQALQFSQALTYLDTSQQQINNTLKAHSVMLNKVDASFKTNIQQVEDNCKSLSARLDKIKK